MDGLTAGVADFLKPTHPLDMTATSFAPTPYLAVLTPPRLRARHGAVSSCPAPVAHRPAWFAAQGGALLRRVGLAAVVPVALVLLWSGALRLGWIPRLILPAPATVLATLCDLLASGELQRNLAISLGRVACGYALGASLGLVLGVGMGCSSTINDYLYPSFRALAQVPVLGWLPVLMLLVGIDEGLKIILIAKAALVPVTLNTTQGLRGVPTRLLEVGRIFTFSRRQVLWRVVFPAAMPSLWNGLRYGLTHAWLALVAVELLASSEGIGFMIVYGRQLYQLDVVLAAVVVVGGVGLGIDLVLRGIERHLLRWRHEAF